MIGLTGSSPYSHGTASVNKVMLTVIAALLPAIAAHLWLFGPALLVNLILASATALISESLFLLVRRRPVAESLVDGSALLTAMLLAIAMPPLAPWWLVVTGTAFAIVFGKQIYGGLGYNPFNPAMLGYVVLLISFPLEMTSWLAPASLRGADLSFATALHYVFTGSLSPGLTLDAVTAATPLDTVKTQLALDQTLETIRTASVFGTFAGEGWEWVNGLFLLGGVALIIRGTISWHTPVAMLAALAMMAGIFHLAAPEHYAGPLFHLFGGGTLLGAFFIATDPVSGPSSDRGRLIFGAGIGVLTYIIRTWGGYPDGVAFAVLLMNMAAPTIDYYVRPRVFGHQEN